MATFRRLGAGGQVQLAADVKTVTPGGKSVYPEPRFVVMALAAIVAGVILGTIIYDHLTKATFKAPEGVGIFALFYVIAQAIERVQEPITPFLGTAPDTGSAPPKRVNQLKAKAALETALAETHDAAAAKVPDTMKLVANKKRTLDQIRANLTMLLFGTGAFLGMVFSGYLKAFFLTTIGVTGLLTWVNVLVTGLVVAGGTKSLHDLISNITESKEKKQEAAAAG